MEGVNYQHYQPATYSQNLKIKYIYMNIMILSYYIEEFPSMVLKGNL